MTTPRATDGPEWVKMTSGNIFGGGDALEIGLYPTASGTWDWEGLAHIDVFPYTVTVASGSAPSLADAKIDAIEWAQVYHRDKMAEWQATAVALDRLEESTPGPESSDG